MAAARMSSIRMISNSRVNIRWERRNLSRAASLHAPVTAARRTIRIVGIVRNRTFPLNRLAIPAPHHGMRAAPTTLRREQP